MSSAFDRVARQRGLEPLAARPAHLHVVPDEPELEQETTTHRPPRLAEVIGQGELVMRLESHIKSAILRGRVPGHVLLDGASGFGKTTFAKAFHGELVARGVTSRLHVVMPEALPTVRDLAVQLGALTPGDVLFLDEVHGYTHAVQEGLYTAMEDGFIAVKGEDGADLVPVVPFTLIGATTDPGKMKAPLKNRFAFHGHLEPYTPRDLARLLLAHCERAGIQLKEDAAQVIARASRYTPRRAIELLNAVQVYSDEVTGDPTAELDSECALQGMEYAGVDEYGLDSRDRRVLRMLCDDFRGGPVGLAPLTAALQMDRTELTRDVEPYLMQAGLIALKGRGRAATRATYLVLGAKVPAMLNGWR